MTMSGHSGQARYRSIQRRDCCFFVVPCGLVQALAPTEKANAYALFYAAAFTNGARRWASWSSTALRPSSIKLGHIG
jgi:hypothetical protein